jgi:hypothetical protein
MSDQILTIIVMNLEHIVVLLDVQITVTIFTTHHFIHNLRMAQQARVFIPGKSFPTCVTLKPTGPNNKL